MDGENLILINRKNNRNYTVRKDRRRYFFPDEWEKFIGKVSNAKHKILFKTLLYSGARIMEALHLRPKDFNFERKTITLCVIKQRKAKKNYFATGTSRTFFVSENYLKEMKSYIKKNNIDDNKYIFLNNEKLPANYDELSNAEKKPYFQNVKVGYHNILKSKLKKAGIEDWKNFSLHNIRKTYGNWMRTLNIDISELCYRLGHDMPTYQTHYGSALIFNDRERRQILKIFGEL